MVLLFSETLWQNFPMLCISPHWMMTSRSAHNTPRTPPPMSASTPGSVYLPPAGLMPWITWSVTHLCTETLMHQNFRTFPTFAPVSCPFPFHTILFGEIHGVCTCEASKSASIPSGCQVLDLGQAIPKDMPMMPAAPQGVTRGVVCMPSNASMSLSRWCLESGFP